jgi:hypothetical protein
MRRARLLGAVLAAAAVFLPSLAAGDELPPSEHVSAQTSVSPRVMLFGAQTKAVLLVLVDPSSVDPRTVRVTANFEPFTVTGAATRRIERMGAATEVRISYRLQCLVAACSHPGGQALVLWRPAKIGWEGAPDAISVDWPRVAVASRLTRADLAHPALRFDASGADRDYRVNPHTLGWAAVGLSGAAVLALGVVLPLRLRRRRLPPAPLDLSTPLEQAIARLERSVDGPPGERRAAIGELAYVLEADGFAELAPLARRLAWSIGGPSGGVAHELALLVRSALETAA